MSERPNHRPNIYSAKLISGRSNIELSHLISKHLGIPLVGCVLDNFSNSESRVEIKEDVRGFNMFIIQTGTFTEELSVNDFIMEMMLLVDACRRSSAKSITVVIPCYPYARADKKDVPRVPISGSMMATIYKAVGVKRIICMDLHSGQIQGFTDLPFDNLYGIGLFIDYLKKNYFSGMDHDEINKNFVLVSPDNGSVKRIESYAQKLQMNMVIMNKSRDYTTKNKVLKSTLVGDKDVVVGRTAIVIDDMVDTCGTMVAAIGELASYGIKDFVIIATHGVLSGPALDRLNKCDSIRSVIVTNTIPQSSNCAKCSKIEVVDTSQLFAEVIRRVVCGGSISELFS